MTLATEFLLDRTEDFRIGIGKRAIEEGLGRSIGHRRAPQLECARLLAPCPFKGNTESDICWAIHAQQKTAP
jgi:hypothetical protein